MNPDVLVTDFHRIDSGSPIIDSNGNVLFGDEPLSRSQLLDQLLGDGGGAARGDDQMGLDL